MYLYIKHIDLSHTYEENIRTKKVNNTIIIRIIINHWTNLSTEQVGEFPLKGVRGDEVTLYWVIVLNKDVRKWIIKYT